MSSYKKSFEEELEVSLSKFQEKYLTKKIEEVYGVIGKFIIDEHESSIITNKTKEKRLN